MSNEFVDHRLLRLKDGQRLPAPYDLIAVYDRDGHLGFRLLAGGEGPTGEGVEIYSKYLQKLGEKESPIQCYKSAVKLGLPHFLPKAKDAKLHNSCNAPQPKWETGSWHNLADDLAAVARMEADRLKAPLARGYLMMFAYSQNDSWDARLTVDPTEIFMSEDVHRIAHMGRGWLMEDVARLAPGILRRNLPLGCQSRYSHSNHAPHQFPVMANFTGPHSAHELMASASRYEEIVAAARG